MAHPFFSFVNYSSISVYEISKDLELILEWLWKWRTSFNRDKNKQAKEVLFLRKLSKLKDPQILFIKVVLFFIPLKSTFHSFRWKTKLYTSYQGRIQKEGIGINVIKSLNNILPWQTLLMIYKSFIRPHFHNWYIIYYQPNKESLCQTTLKLRRWLCMLHMQNSFKRKISLTIND